MRGPRVWSLKWSLKLYPIPFNTPHAPPRWAGGFNRSAHSAGPFLVPRDSYICERLLGSWLLGDKLLSSTYLIEKLCLVDGITSRDTFWATLGVLGASRGPSGAPWGRLRGFWTPWGLSRGASGGLGKLQGCLGARSGRSWGALGHPGRRSGNPLGLHWGARRGPEVLQGLLQGVLGGFWAAVCGSLPVYEIIEKPLIFIVFSAVGSCRGQQQGHLRGLVGYSESLWGSRRGLVSLQGGALDFL